MIIRLMSLWFDYYLLLNEASLTKTESFSSQWLLTQIFKNITTCPFNKILARKSNMWPKKL